MKKITFIYPAIGKKAGQKYVRTWQMEALPIATLVALTPDDIEVEFFDDRLELIDYETKTDLVAISCETYTARRSYDIALKFRERGKKVILGGYHPTHLPDEALEYADSVVVGNAEALWHQVISDARDNRLQKIYKGEAGYASVMPDRSIFEGKNYYNLGLVETGRGCPFTCEFCNITTYYGAKYYPRPVEDVVKDIQLSKRNQFFFVDDNFVANPAYAIELCKAIVPLKIKWVGQGSITMAQNQELLKWMRKSGCEILLIGFESLEEENLKQMNKDWSIKLGEKERLIDLIHKAGINIYATFVFGFDFDTKETFKKTVDFALKQNFYYAAFNHLLPFPCTPLYERLKSENRLLSEQWWLDPCYKYGDLAFRPKMLDPEELATLCYKSRREFFKYSSIMKRLPYVIKRTPSFRSLITYLFSNLDLKKEVDGKYGLPLGEGLDEYPK